MEEPTTSGLSVRQRKNAPLEMSSKKSAALIPVSMSGVKRRRYRDPRFDEQCGTVSKTSEKDYKFVTDIRQRELESIRKEHKKEKDPERKLQVKDLLTRMVHAKEFLFELISSYLYLSSMLPDMNMQKLFLYRKTKNDLVLRRNRRSRSRPSVMFYRSNTSHREKILFI